MPMIDLTYVRGSLDDEALGQLTDELVTALLRAERAPASLMSFGDGSHRCAGLYVALQETDIFLQRLLALEHLRIQQTPQIRWQRAVATYEIRNFIVTVA